MEMRIVPISFLRRKIYFIYCILQVGGNLNRMLRNVNNTHLPIENQRYYVSSIHVQQWLFKAYNEIKILIFQPLLEMFFLKTCLLLPIFHSYLLNIFIVKFVWSMNSIFKSQNIMLYKPSLFDLIYRMMIT